MVKLYEPTEKQHKAWKLLEDKITTHILYGGSVGSGKSHLGCMWVFLSCIKYPGARYLIGRSRLSVLKKTTFKTFMEIVSEFEYGGKVIYNAISNTIKFSNGSEVILMDLFPYPGDVDYVRLGSLEISGAFVDELSEISYKGFEVLFTRIRYKLDEFKITPKLICASNPTIGWPKSFFYKPFVDNTESAHIKFIQALPTDNKYLPKVYLKGLDLNLTGALKERLLKGSWDFSDDDFNIFNYDEVLQSFYNTYDKEEQKINNEAFLTCDVANIGKDLTLIGIWKGLELILIFSYPKTDTPEVIKYIKEKMKTFKVPIKNVIIDADGLGVGVSDHLKGCVPFKGSSSPLLKQNYKNLRAQCYFKLAETITRMILPDLHKDVIIQELIAHKMTGLDKDTKTGIISKDEIKKIINRSPDYADMIMMRVWYLLRPSGKYNIR